MIHYPVAQGGEEWLRLRMGRPTASEFDKLICRGRKKTDAPWVLSESHRPYLIRLVTEMMLDAPLANLTISAFEHGHDWEPKAVAAYEFEQGVDTDACGFCTTDDGLVGASPDRFVGAEGLLEVKCPEKPELHVGYLFYPEKLVAAYHQQTQGQLYVTGRKWTDLISYFGGLPMVCARVEPDVEFQKSLSDALKLFTDQLTWAVSVARDRGWIKAREGSGLCPTGARRASACGVKIWRE